MKHMLVGAKILILVACAGIFLACPARAQFKISETFTQTSAPGWTFADSASLTAPSIDAPGSGWLRLTAALANQKGSARYTSGSFAGNQAVVVKFSYVSWGGNGADGTSIFLYDSTQDMSGAEIGGGLGYCSGAGGYLAIGLDEYGNFSFPFYNCVNGGGPGRAPESFVIRGPTSANNPYVTGAVIAGGIDNPGVATRPTAKSVILTLMPVVGGYTISALLQTDVTQPYQTIFANVAFPYAPPASLSLGFSAGTGAKNNIHELGNAVVSSPDDVQVTATGPASVAPGNTITYTVTVVNNGPASVAATDAPTVVDALPAGIGNVAWTCTGSAGGTCPPSGIGSLATSPLTLPVNSSVTYTVTGTVAAGAACNSTLVNTAQADFGPASNYTDDNPNGNTATVTSTVDCSHQTLLVNPTSLVFGPQTLNVASAPLAVSVSGTDGVAVTGISVTGAEFTQTNNCVAPLAGAASCMINVMFVPGAEGSRNATLTIQSTSAASPTLISLSGTGTSAVPNAFSFMPLTSVDPATIQISNPITVQGSNVASAIAISSGEYSINGGPFTAAAGTVSPGATVVVRLTSSSLFDTADVATLTIGGVAAPFSVTTRVAVPGTLTFSSANYAASGAATVVDVVVTRTGGTDGVVSAEIVDTAGNVRGTVTFAAGVGGSQTVALPLTSADAGGMFAIELKQFTGGAGAGGIASSTVAVSAAPLGPVVVRSGAGAFDLLSVLALAVLVGLRLIRAPRSTIALCLCLLAFGSRGVRAAEDGSLLSSVYVDIRGGGSLGTLSAGHLDSRLAAKGYDVQSAVADTGVSGTVSVGVDMSHAVGLELGWTYLGRTRATLTGVLPGNLNQVLNDAAHITRGGGDGLSLELRYRITVVEGLDVDLRSGPYVWSTHSDISVDSSSKLERTDRGLGYAVGIEPRWRVTPHVGLGVGLDYWVSTGANRFLLLTAGARYHF